jgi:Arc/MetJ-type ribon-helix-helix transcriptional regulator
MYNYIMERTQISLTAEQHRRLARLAVRQGRSMSSLIREAVDTVYGDERSTEQDLDAIRQAFGAWDGTEADGTSYVERLRSGTRMRPE